MEKLIDKCKTVYLIYVLKRGLINNKKYINKSF